MPSKLRSVILVGFHRHPATAALAEQLQSFGYQISQADTPEEISTLLSGRPRSAVAVFSPKRTGDVHRVLTALDSSCHEVPLVVIVEESDFGEYYSLMNRGVKEYFEVREQPEVILRGLAWAARSLGD